ncbi:Peptidase C39, bacteriocin processing domain protein, partial [mine drainage metagenome]
LHWDLNHFVVLKQATAKVLVIHDPAQGVRRMRIEEASRHFTGVALELWPAPKRGPFLTPFFGVSEPDPVFSFYGVNLPACFARSTYTSGP